MIPTLKPERSSRPSSQRVTSADVAAAAGVSRATVSYVINGVEGRISGHTRTRVLEAAARLGYVANEMASALRTGRTEIVLLALPAWPLGPAVADWITTGVTELELLGYTPLVHLRQGDDSESLTRACARVRPVGLVAPAEELTPERVSSLLLNGTQAIVAIGQQPLDHVTTLVVDQALVGGSAVTHLIERGHRNIIAVIPGEPQFAAIGRDRLRGARDAATSRGASLQVVEATCSMHDIGRALTPVLSSQPAALYAFNDDYALEAIGALEAMGRNVPGDTAVIGCDDSAAARRAKLTTIRLSDPRGWDPIVRRLHALIDGTDDRTPILAYPTLVPGETT